MTLVITSEEINKDIEKFVKVFYYMKKQNIAYTLKIITKDYSFING